MFVKIRRFIALYIDSLIIFFSVYYLKESLLFLFDNMYYWCFIEAASIVEA